MNIQTFTFNPFQQHTYIVWQDTDAIIIDAGCYTPHECNIITEFVQKHNLTIHYNLLTHGHLDHIFGARFLAETYHLTPHLMPADEQLFRNLQTQATSVGITLLSTPFDQYTPLENGQILSLSDLSIRTIATPGHTQGSCCFLFTGTALNAPTLFSGDTLFQNSIGRTDLPGGNYNQLMDSLNRELTLLPPETIIYAGHGAPTTLANELKYNPYLTF